MLFDFDFDFDTVFDLDNPTQGARTLSRTRISISSLEQFAELWSQTRASWQWSCPFILPFWLAAVRRHLEDGGEPHIVTVHDAQGFAGSMPLCVEGPTARFLGSHEVCDYQDMVSAPGRHRLVLEAVLSHLAGEGIRRLDLRTLRPESLTLDALAAVAPQPHTELLSDEVSFETGLPPTWEGYLERLDGKQRHEIRRKQRRLEDQGSVLFRCASNADEAAQARFLALFRANRADKAAFMTPAMEAYFRLLTRELAGRRMLRLGFLELNGLALAGVLCFDYGTTRYLYNSGYDEQFEWLSVGALSKIYSIRDAVAQGCRRYDFLKGAEVYKKRLGGKATQLYRCKVEL